MAFPLLADRFLPLAHALYLDLATGDRAWLRVAPARQQEAALRWAEHCAALTSVWHPGMAECVDHGLLGTSQQFEAYRMNHLLPRSHGRMSDAARTRDRVAEFLVACGIAPGAHAIEGGDAAGRWLVVPGSAPDEPAEPEGVADEPWTGVRRARRRASVGPQQSRPADGTMGVRLVHRTVYDALRERLCAEPPTGISVTDVEVAPGAGGRTLLRYCAREARRLGWVAIATPALRWIGERRDRQRTMAWDDIVAGRHVVVLHDGRRSSRTGDRELAAIVLRLGTHVPRPHRLIQLVLRPRASDSLTLAPLTPAELSGMLVLVNEARRARARIDRLASTSGGLPGRFIDAALRLCAPPPRVPNPIARACTRYTTPGRPLGWTGRARAAALPGMPQPAPAGSRRAARAAVPARHRRPSVPERGSPRCGARSPRVSAWQAPGGTRPPNGCCGRRPLRRRDAAARPRRAMPSSRAAGCT